MTRFQTPGPREVSDTISSMRSNPSIPSILSILPARRIRRSSRKATTPKTTTPACAPALLLALALALLLTGSPASALPPDDPVPRILGAALVDQDGWEKLEHLTTVIGHRLSGSPQLEEAIVWASEAMRDEGLENVRTPEVMVPYWVRGEESAELLAPQRRPLPILGLGRSVGTPEGGIEAPVVVVESFDHLDLLPDEEIEGRIVVYAVPWEGYGGTVIYRSAGASRAAARGAVAVLVRSATGRSLSTPHTGALRYDEAEPMIPAAAITPEDAEWMKRVAQRGEEIRVRLTMGAKTLPDAASANVIAEIVGSELPDEVVVMGGHYDSWDVGQGAHDDGAACMAAWHALTLIHRLGLRPRRTLRVVLWTNEENGLRGGQAYRDSLGDDVASHVAAIEMDSGVETPLGLGLGLVGIDAESGDPVYEGAYEALRAMAAPLEAIGAGTISRGGGGADIGPLMRDGVPGLGMRTVGEHYFDWHHTWADTLDKVDPQDFRKAVALLAVMGWSLAESPDRLVPAEWTPPPGDEEE